MTLNFTEATAYRKKWMPALFQEILHKALVAEKVFTVDNSDEKYIENPYGDAGVVTQQAIAGTYSVDAFTVTANTLTVSEEFVWAEHVYDFEKVASVADVKGSRMKEAMAQMATAVDKYALNALCDGGTGTYTTPTGGFSDPANVTKIAADLLAKFAGYNYNFSGGYVVIEPSDLSGVIQAQFGNGFATADRALNNGFINNWGGLDWYVAGTGTFVSATLGTATFTNSGHRVAGVRGLATLAMPGGKMQWMEKEVSGKTGVELAMVAYAGVAVWAKKAELTIDITLA